LVLEDGLAGLESRFVEIRDKTFFRRKEFTLDDRLILCAFIAAARARTPAQRDHLGGFWNEVRQRMDDLKDWAATATPEQKQAAAMVAPGSGPSLGYDEVRHMAERPMQTMLAPRIESETPLLLALDLAVVESETSAAFITSDNPCVWFDPEAYKRPPFYQRPA